MSGIRIRGMIGMLCGGTEKLVLKEKNKRGSIGYDLSLGYEMKFGDNMMIGTQLYYVILGGFQHNFSATDITAFESAPAYFRSFSLSEGSVTLKEGKLSAIGLTIPIGFIFETYGGFSTILAIKIGYQRTKTILESNTEGGNSFGLSNDVKKEIPEKSFSLALKEVKAIKYAFVIGGMVSFVMPSGIFLGLEYDIMKASLPAYKAEDFALSLVFADFYIKGDQRAMNDPLPQEGNTSVSSEMTEVKNLNLQRLSVRVGYRF